MRWSIRYQMLLPPGLLLLGVVGISTWTARAAADNARRQIAAQMQGIAETLRDASFDLSYPHVQAQLKGLSAADYLLVQPDGRRTTTLPTEAVELPPVGTAGGEGDALGPTVQVGGRAYRCRPIAMSIRSQNPGATLYVLYPDARLRDAQWEAVRPSLILGGGGGLLAVALTLGAGQRLVRRIQELERRTRLIAAGDFSPLPLPRRDDELRDLGRSVNEMAQQLAQFQETMRKSERLRLLGQVSGGLAHQLRNGVAGARLAVQLHARGCADGNAEALQVALRQLALVEASLRRFLDLGRAEAGRREPCALATLVAEAVALLTPQCRHTGTELRWQPPADEPEVLGDAAQLGHLILNLLGNAVEAAGPGGTVEVRLRAPPEGGPVTLEVYDTGPGPPAEVAERLFEPFVTGKRDGVGLGLAVARQVAESHRGRIDWRRQDRRTCFRVELPAAPGKKE